MRSSLWQKLRPSLVDIARGALKSTASRVVALGGLVAVLALITFVGHGPRQEAGKAGHLSRRPVPKKNEVVAARVVVHKEHAPAKPGMPAGQVAGKRPAPALKVQQASLGGSPVQVKKLLPVAPGDVQRKLALAQQPQKAAVPAVRPPAQAARPVPAQTPRIAQASLLVAPNLAPARPARAALEVKAAMNVPSDPEADFGITVPVASQYSYNPDGRRDPFQTLLKGEFEGEHGDGGQPLVDIADLQLMGVLRKNNEYYAMVEDSKHHGFTLRVGDPVLNGRVTQIDRDVITVNLSSYGESQTVRLHLNNANSKAGE